MALFGKNKKKQQEKYEAFLQEEAMLGFEYESLSKRNQKIEQTVTDLNDTNFGPIKQTLTYVFKDDVLMVKENVVSKKDNKELYEYPRYSILFKDKEGKHRLITVTHKTWFNREMYSEEDSYEYQDGPENNTDILKKETSHDPMSYVTKCNVEIENYNKNKANKTLD